MNKYLIYLWAVALASMTFVACSDDEVEVTEPTLTEAEIELRLDDVAQVQSEVAVAEEFAAGATLFAVDQAPPGFEGSAALSRFVKEGAALRTSNECPTFTYSSVVAPAGENGGTFSFDLTVDFGTGCEFQPEPESPAGTVSGSVTYTVSGEFDDLAGTGTFNILATFNQLTTDTLSINGTNGMTLSWNGGEDSDVITTTVDQDYSFTYYEDSYTVSADITTGVNYTSFIDDTGFMTFGGSYAVTKNSDISLTYTIDPVLEYDFACFDASGTFNSGIFTAVYTENAVRATIAVDFSVGAPETDVADACDNWVTVSQGGNTYWVDLEDGEFLDTFEPIEF